MFNAVFNLFGIIVFLIMVQGFWGEFWKLGGKQIAGVPGVITFIVWPFYLILPVGAAATGIEFCCASWKWLARARLAKPSDSASATKRGYGWLIALASCAIVIYLLTTAELTNAQIGISIICMLILIYAGMPIGIALIVLGLRHMDDERQHRHRRTDAAAGGRRTRKLFLRVVPLFVLMGLLVAQADVGKETFQVALALRRVRGGLGIVTLPQCGLQPLLIVHRLGCGVYAVATPEMMSQGYTARFSVGVVAGSSVRGC